MYRFSLVLQVGLNVLHHSIETVEVCFSLVDHGLQFVDVLHERSQDLFVQISLVAFVAYRMEFRMI